MHRTQLIGTTLLLALLAPAGRDVRATGSTADIVFEWNQILQDTVPVPHGVLTPRFFAMTHIAMFDADQHASSASSSRIASDCATGAADRPKPPPRKPHTMCSSSSTRLQPRPTMRRSRVRSASRPSGFVRRGAASVPASPRRFWRGDRTTGGWSRRFHRIPSRCCPDAGSRPRRTIRSRHSRICRTPRRWPC